MFFFHHGNRKSSKDRVVGPLPNVTNYLRTGMALQVRVYQPYGICLPFSTHMNGDMLKYFAGKLWFTMG